MAADGIPAGAVTWGRGAGAGAGAGVACVAAGARTGWGRAAQKW